MDTKSKNSRLLAVAGLVLALTLSILTLADIDNHRENLQEDYYFDSSSFYGELSTEVDLIKTAHVDFAEYEGKLPLEKIDKESFKQVNQDRDESLNEFMQEITDQYEPRIKEAQQAKKADEVARLTAERESKIAQRTQKVQADLQARIDELIAEKEQEYEDAKTSLTFRNSSFKYYIFDHKRGRVYTNLDHEPTASELKETALYSFSFPQNSYPNSSRFSDLNRSLQINQWKGVIYVPVTPDGYSQIHADATYFDSVRDRLLWECGLLTVTLLSSAALLWYAHKQAAAQLSVVQKGLALLRRVPLDIRIILLLPALIIYLGMAYDRNFFSFPISSGQIFTLVVMVPLTAFFLLYALEGWSMFNDPQQLRQQWQKSLWSSLASVAKESFSNRSVFFKVALVCVLTVGLGMSLAMGLVGLAERAEELLIITFLYGVFYAMFVLPYIFRRIGLLNRVLRGASQMAAGDLHATIKEKPRGQLAELAHSINNIKQGLQHSVASQMKSERLKSELITNVSHDLKTPLTSIINYVDLLKRDDLNPEDIKSYVAVLERKTDRLRVLIEDLFEAAKTASGSVELDIEPVNVSALLNQAIAEFSDKMDQSTLTFRVNIEQPKIVAPLDGKKTWRVFENLIGNALKYSMPHTRVLIDLSEQPEGVVLTIKNVSAYEIDFAADELFERFKRADESRNTEGSGLGLTIAKSIVELQGGKLNIDIDGDYFKVTVIFRR